MDEINRGGGEGGGKLLPKQMSIRFALSEKTLFTCFLTGYSEQMASV